MERLSPVTLALLRLSAGLALAAMLGSLYLSEIRGYVPCNLCWFQRVFAYSTTVMLLAAQFWRALNIERARGVVSGAQVLVVAWVAMALFHVAEQLGLIAEPAMCLVRSAAPCSVSWPLWSSVGMPGFLDSWLSIPVLSLLSGVGVLLLLGSTLRSMRES